MCASLAQPPLNLGIPPLEPSGSLILVVDDDKTTRKLLCRFLEAEGYRIAAASNGEQGLEAYDRLHPNVILLDAQMPVMDGFSCCDHLRQSSRFEHTPVLMITSLDDQQSVDRAFEVGATDYITKPIHWAVLRKRLQHLIRQSRATEVLQHLNLQLEAQVQERTAQLRQALDFEASLKRITDKVRDSLDEDQILQTAVQELASRLRVDACHTALYDLELTTATIIHEDRVWWMPSLKGKVLQRTDFPELYNQLLQGQYGQFCEISPDQDADQTRVLICPMLDDQGALGDLCLMDRRETSFDDLEIRLVQQVANQCAIALRQARLYRAAQVQVKELEKLNQLKDDFLCTVSHELRTPLSALKMGLQMLSSTLEQDSDLNLKCQTIGKYLPILQTECDQEIRLVNDLLTLQQLEAGEYPLERTTLELQAWLPEILASLQERASTLKQHLKLDLPASLPCLAIHPFSLERALTELVSNALKYTAANQEIVVAARTESEMLEISVCNPGVEIAPSELPRIFDKFYRIPTADPWSQGGTGLGLALVQKLVGYLGASIRVESAAGQTCFTIVLPLEGV
ncbi:MAG: response regulator [Leptolyngbyaceae bacterium]|nr:response regulator [Leptolyngbyaceae bacterium]